MSPRARKKSKTEDVVVSGEVLEERSRDRLVPPARTPSEGSSVIGPKVAARLAELRKEKEDQETDEEAEKIETKAQELVDQTPEMAAETHAKAEREKSIKNQEAFDARLEVGRAAKTEEAEARGDEPPEFAEQPEAKE